MKMLFKRKRRWRRQRRWTNHRKSRIEQSCLVQGSRTAHDQNDDLLQLVTTISCSIVQSLSKQMQDVRNPQVKRSGDRKIARIWKKLCPPIWKIWKKVSGASNRSSSGGQNERMEGIKNEESASSLAKRDLQLN